MSNEQLLFAALTLVLATAYALYSNYLLFHSTPAERESRKQQFIANVDKVIEGAEKLTNETKDTEFDNDMLAAFKVFWKMYKAGRFELANIGILADEHS